jgi:hypothetical protein
MSRLVRLYPRAWRDRYEDEFLGLITDRPPTLLDRIDIVRGALDAHLHPQLPGSEPEPQPVTHRIPGLIALTAGLLWTANVAYLAVRSDLTSDWGSLIGIAFVLMLISLPGDYLADDGRRIALAIGAVAASIVGANLLGWGWPAFVLYVTAELIVLAGFLVVAAIRAGIGSSGRWRLVVVTIALPLLIGIPAAVGVTETSPAARLLYALTLPYGLAWVLIGLRMAIRGAPTIIDPPAIVAESEVQPA